MQRTFVINNQYLIRIFSNLNFIINYILVKYNNLQHEFLFIFKKCPIVNEILYESRDKKIISRNIEMHKIISRNLEINLEEKKISRFLCLEIHLEI